MSLLGLMSCKNTISSNGNNNQNQPKNQLALLANGEDFIRKGFISKDGWQLTFDKVDLNLGKVTAYQTNTPFNPDVNQEIDFSEKSELVKDIIKINLAEGDEKSPPILVTQKEVAIGNYNALSWSLIPRNNEDNNYSILLEGIATKDNQNINFSLKFNEPLTYLCGEYVGEERKGIVTEENSAQVEITLHFDHLFGDESMSQDDEINQDALGFEPFSNLATSNNIKVDQITLQNKFDSPTYETLQNIFKNLGHVGEGHCIVES